MNFSKKNVEIGKYMGQISQKNWYMSVSMGSLSYSQQHGPPSPENLKYQNKMMQYQNLTTIKQKQKTTTTTQKKKIYNNNNRFRWPSLWKIKIGQGGLSFFLF